MLLETDETVRSSVFVRRLLYGRDATLNAPARPNAAPVLRGSLRGQTVRHPHLMASALDADESSCHTSGRLALLSWPSASGPPLQILRCRASCVRIRDC
jgi:hypothetical protein